MECHGLRLEAERAVGRRNKIETVLVSVLADEATRDKDAADAAPSPVTSSGR